MYTHASLGTAVGGHTPSLPPCLFPIYWNLVACIGGNLSGKTPFVSHKTSSTTHS